MCGKICLLSLFQKLRSSRKNVVITKYKKKCSEYPQILPAMYFTLPEMLCISKIEC